MINAADGVQKRVQEGEVPEPLNFVHDEDEFSPFGRAVAQTQQFILPRFHIGGASEAERFSLCFEIHVQVTGEGLEKIRLALVSVGLEADPQGQPGGAGGADLVREKLEIGALAALARGGEGEIPPFLHFLQPHREQFRAGDVVVPLLVDGAFGAEAPGHENNLLAGSERPGMFAFSCSALRVRNKKRRRYPSLYAGLLAVLPMLSFYNTSGI